MDTMRDGSSVVKTPLLDGSNYSFWKARMKVFLKFLDLKVWHSMCNGWTTPVVTTDGVDKQKPIKSGAVMSLLPMVGIPKV